VTASAPGTAVAHSTRAATMRREHRRRDIATLISLLISVCFSDRNGGARVLYIYRRSEIHPSTR
jgi:hypothetical protein